MVVSVWVMLVDDVERCDMNKHKRDRTIPHRCLSCRSASSHLARSSGEQALNLAAAYQ